MKKNDSLSNSDNSRRWKRRELGLLILYAIAFYAIVIRRSVHISRGNQKFHYHRLPNPIFHFICFKMIMILDSTNSQIITPDSTVYAPDGSQNLLIFPMYLLSALPLPPPFFFQSYINFYSIFLWCRMSRMLNGGTFEEIYRFLRLFLGYLLWWPIH